MGSSVYGPPTGRRARFPSRTTVAGTVPAVDGLERARSGAGCDHRQRVESYPDRDRLTRAHRPDQIQAIRMAPRQAGAEGEVPPCWGPWMSSGTGRWAGEDRCDRATGSPVGTE